MSSGTVSRYTFETSDGQPFGEFVTFDYAAACDYGRENELRVIEHEYEWTDSSLVADYSPSEPEPDAELVELGGEAGGA